MGFPDRVIVGRTEDDNAFHGGFNLDQKGQAFQQINASNLMQLLAQLIDARRFAQEIFTELAEETVKTSERIKAVSSRVRQVSEVVPGIQRIFHETSPDCFLMPTSVKLERNTNIKGGIFIRRGAPEKVDRRRHGAIDPPNLNALNKFSKALDLTNLKKENPALDESNLRCGDKYSLPQFFFQQWLEQEAEKHRVRKKIRKQRKAERKAARKKKKEEKLKKKGGTVSKVKKKYVDQFGQIYYKEVGGDVNIAQRSGVQRAKDVKVTAHTYGSPEINLNQDYGDKTSAAGTFELGANQPIQNEILVPPTAAAIPPPVVHTNPNHVNVAMPEPVRQPPPPVHHHQPPPVHHHQPPVHQPTGPPVHPQHNSAPPPAPMPNHSAAPPAQPAAPAMPEYMAPYAKMKKFGLGEWQIKGKMKTNGDDPEDYDRYLGDGVSSSGSAAAPPPTPMGRAPPPRPGGNSRPPANPRRAAPMDLMASLRQGHKLKSSSSRPAPVQPRRPAPSGGGMMAAIRAGAKLKKAKDRAPPPPRELTGQDAVLAAIRGGRQLKKAADRQLKEKEPVEETGNIFALLKLRAKIAESDNEDSDSGSWDSDSDS